MIGIVDDFNLEDPEFFNVPLSTSDSDVTIPTPVAVVTIIDNDAVTIGLEQTEYSVREEDESVEICVLSSNPVQRQLIVSLTTANISAGKSRAEYAEADSGVVRWVHSNPPS